MLLTLLYVMPGLALHYWNISLPLPSVALGPLNQLGMPGASGEPIETTPVGLVDTKQTAHTRQVRIQNHAHAKSTL